jgi:hypothetical protein
MKRQFVVLGSLCSIAAIGCGSGASQPEGYVLLDPDARQAGVSLEVGDHVATSALPIAVSGGEHVTLHTGDGETALAVGQDELVYVQGPQAHVSHLKMGTDIAIDQLRVAGDEGAAKELASQIGGTVGADGDQWRVHMPSVFAGAAFAGVPERLVGASPVMLGELAAATQAAAVAEVVLPPAPLEERAAAASVPRASPVSFAAATGCSGVGGQWRGRVYSDRHGQYYDFTLTVRPSGGAALLGTVVAEMWSAATDQVEPPGATACSGAQHATVVEGASGSVDANGNMHFDSKSWRVGSHMCGPRVTGYSPDRFEVPLANGASSAHAVVSDDVVWTDGLPLELTRISCQ